MSPENAVCFLCADIDCCVLTNNHISIGHAGLFDTLESRACLRIESAGAGLDIDQASEPAALDLCQSSVHFRANMIRLVEQQLAAMHQVEN